MVIVKICCLNHICMDYNKNIKLSKYAVANTIIYRPILILDLLYTLKPLKRDICNEKFYDA